MLILVEMKKCLAYRVGPKVHVLRFDISDAVQHLHSLVCQQRPQKIKLIRRTMNFLINWSTSESNPQEDPTACLGDTGGWIQQVTAPSLVVTCCIHLCASILPSICTEGAKPPLSN